MDTATKILIIAGMVNLLIGALSGIPMALERQGGAEVVPKYLTDRRSRGPRVDVITADGAARETNR